MSNQMEDYTQTHLLDSENTPWNSQPFQISQL